MKAYIYGTLLALLSLPMQLHGQTVINSFTPSGFSQTCDVGVFSDGNIITADCGTDVSEKCDASGNLLNITINQPVNCVSINNNDEVHILASDSLRIYNASGVQIHSRTAIDGADITHNLTGSYYVVAGSLVQVYNPFGGDSGSLSLFSDAVAISYSINYALFAIADKGANEVIVYNFGFSSVIATIPTTDPNGVAWLSDGRLVVNHQDSISFYQEGPSGYFLEVTSSLGGALNGPTKMSVNSSDEIYLVNKGANEILVIEPPLAVVLAVELTAFSVRPMLGEDRISWFAASEINHDRYELERSTDAKNFSKVTEVEGKGSNNHYSVDVIPIAGVTNYYRLKDIDKDGRIGYSDIISSRANDSELFTFGANPSNGELNLSHPATLVHASGKTEMLQAGYQILSVRPGLYFLRTYDGISYPLIIVD